MPKTLTSWKEIAQYLNKGVRTVQRWERCLGLPVRRPHGRLKGTVLAFSDDIDTWLQSEFGRDTELDKLRTEVVSLREENKRLREALEQSVTPEEFAHIENRTTDELFWQQRSSVVERSPATALHRDNRNDLQPQSNPRDLPAAKERKPS